MWPLITVLFFAHPLLRMYYMFGVVYFVFKNMNLNLKCVYGAGVQAFRYKRSLDC